MLSTRRPQQIQIYQDPIDQMSQLPPHNRPRPQLAPSAMPLQPMRNIQPTSMPPAPVLYPTMSAPSQFSPLKSQHFTPPPAAANHEYGYVNIMPNMHMPETAPLYTGSPSEGQQPQTAQMHFPVPSMPPQRPMYGAFDSNFEPFEQGHFPAPMSQPPQQQQSDFVQFPDPSFIRRQPLKRSYSDAAIVRDRQAKGPAKLEEDGGLYELPQPEDMPVVEDNGQKPPYSYAQMVGMAILRAPGRRLTLSNIYEWIASTFQFYRDQPGQGWHNSIRHNLSLNKAFVKKERPKGDAGKGCYWTIKPGMEMQFYKEKSRKNNNAGSNIMLQHNIGMPTIQALPQPVSEAMAPRQWIIQSQPDLTSDMMPPRPQTAPALPELSSDATVPASDPALHEEGEAVSHQEIPDVPAQSMLPPPPSSPPVINSSPPIATHAHHHTISSPTNANRSSLKRKCNANVVDDSGYYSSLESSVRRSKVNPLTSEAGYDKVQTKHGRAEEEIARIRSSSHDITPSHKRFKNIPPEVLRSSSPDRQVTKLDPTTPAIIFKKPQAPPQSVSPNTQLRNHREAMSHFMPSPLKLDDPFTTGFDAFSPASKTGTSTMNHFDENFFAYDFTMPGTPLASSPLKPFYSAKRPILSHSKTAGILADVTKRANGVPNKNTPSKIPGSFLLKPTPMIGSLGSPLKKSHSAASFEIFNDENAEALFDFNSFADEASEGEELDISQGFAKIGGCVATSIATPAMSKGLGLTRPGLGRSFTSRF